MQKEKVIKQIEEILFRILAEQGKQTPQINPSTQLFGGDELEIDSLDLAVLVAELEQVTSKDPFKAGFIEFRTVEDLARLYGD